MPAFAIRFDEQQLLDMAAKARVLCSKKAYLHKSDSKLNRLKQRWCCIYQNMLFYFESESVPKPLGVVLLEGCISKPVEQTGQPNTEGAFCICNSEGSNGKVHYFIAKNDKERNDWIEVLSNANMAKLRQELEEVRSRCEEFCTIASTRTSEVQHLKQANLQAQQDIEHLRGALQCSATTRHRSSNVSNVSRGSNASPLPPDSPDLLERNATVLQGYIRSWLRRRCWRRIVREYMDSSLSDVVKKRNQLMWKFVASEEDYVSQLTILHEEYRQHFEIAAASRNPPLTLKQSSILFRNSNELLLLHQLLLRGLHSCIDKWPVVVFGDLLKLFTPMFSIYHKFIGDHSYAYEVLLGLLSEPPFKELLDWLQARPSCNSMTLDSLLTTPLRRLTSYVKELQELCAHMSPDHVDYIPLSDIIAELECIHKMATDETSQGESIRQVLKVESMIEGGCRELLDKEQALIKQGVLQQVRIEDKSGNSSLPWTSGGSKLRTQQRHCFLFSKHLLITTRVSKKPTDYYKPVKIFPLTRCRVSECRQSDIAEVVYRAIKVDFNHGNELESIILMGTSINEKAEWMADITQCVENEKQNKILLSQSVGEPVELSSKFIRYSTFRTGKEQLVNSGSLDCLLERLVKISYFGLDFLNTFLMTFPLFTDARTVFEYLEKCYWECLQTRERRRGSVSPQAAVRDARAIQSQSFPRTVVMGPNKLSRHLNLPVNKHKSLSYIRRISSTSTDSKGSSGGDSRGSRPSLSEETNSGGPVKSVSGILFALKHWICKHFFHFREDPELLEKLEMLVENANSHPLLTLNEKNAAMEVSNMFQLQSEARDELCPVLQLKLCKDPVHLPQKPFECLLLWNPRETAEQLCLIESAMFQRIGNDEILRYFTAKGEAKARVSPNLTAIFEHFNRMSLFFMWSLPNQRYFVDRIKILEFLIQLAWECYQFNNFSSLMQLTSALEHGSTAKFKSVWENIPKNLKMQFQQLVHLSSTDGRFKELRSAMKKAPPPTVPYLGILLSEMSGVVEGLPTYLEESLINFTKMRKCVRLITSALQHQKDPYEFNFIPEVCQVLLHTTVPGNEDDLYRFVDSIEDK